VQFFPKVLLTPVSLLFFGQSGQICFEASRKLSLPESRCPFFEDVLSLLRILRQLQLTLAPWLCTSFPVPAQAVQAPPCLLHPNLPNNSAGQVSTLKCTSLSPSKCSIKTPQMIIEPVVPGFQEFGARTMKCSSSYLLPWCLTKLWSTHLYSNFFLALSREMKGRLWYFILLNEGEFYIFKCFVRLYINFPKHFKTIPFQQCQLIGGGSAGRMTPKPACASWRWNVKKISASVGKFMTSPVPVARTWNPSYSEGRDQEDLSLKPDQGK
jgi:hypothetical protein